MAPRFIARQLSRPTGFFGRIMGQLMNWHNAKLNSYAVRQLELTPSDHVLEVGFGGGVTLRSLLASAAFVAGVDRSSDMVGRAKAMADKFHQWEVERGTDPTAFPGARYVLLHSLAHTLVRQLSLDCGYSASSVRERIYSSTDPNRKMAGVLLYTASPDSEGSLGGLVDLASPQRFPDLFKSALRSATRCSSDPLCADHQPDVHSTINAAACHACILASETSCEAFNRFLDRNVLVPTMASSSLAYFFRST